MSYAIIVDGVVVNVAVWDGESEWQPDGELVKLEDGLAAGPGWSYKKGKFIPPAEEAV